MSILTKLRVVKAYAADHLGTNLTEFWLNERDVRWLRLDLMQEMSMHPMVFMEPDDPNFGDFVVEGMAIKQIGKDDRLCRHIRTTHFRDVNEVYCHDCRTIIGTGEPETHKRNSTI